MRLRTPMRRAGRAWLALAIAGSTGIAKAAPDPLRATPVTGGWTREGWSDDVAATTTSPALSADGGASRARGSADGPARATLPVVDTRPAPAASGGPASGATPGEGQAPAARPMAPTGGWTRDGWSDDVAATSTVRPAPTVQGIAPPPAPRRIGVDAAGRRLPWDGGRGPTFRYERGQRLPILFVEQPYRVDDWIGYGLPAPPAGHRWIRYFDDAVMIDESALVLDAVPGIDWATPPAIYGPTPRVIDGATGEAQPVRTDGSTTTEIRSTPGGGRVMVTTTTTPEVATTVIEQHEVP